MSAVVTAAGLAAARAVEVAHSVAKQRTGEALKSGPWGLAMLLLLCIAVYFLWRSMNKHLKNVREREQSGERFDVPDPSLPQPPAGAQAPTAPPAHHPGAGASGSSGPSPRD